MKAPTESVRILFAHWGDEGIRGSERVLLDLLAKLDRNQYAPVLWCNAETMADAARSLGVKVHLSPMPILFSWGAVRMDVPAYARLIKHAQMLIRTERVELVHANSGAPNQWLVPAARQAAIPLVAHLHAIYKLRDRCTLLLHQAPMLVGCSEAVVRPLCADGVPKRRLKVIHNGVDPDRISAGQATSLRRSLGIGADSILIATVAALIPLKGVDLVVRALHVVVERGVDAHLAIIGDGPERERLQLLAIDLALSDRVHFLGSQPEVGAILRDAVDIVAIGSQIEAFPLVPAEAGLMGRPVVATRVGGIPELVEDGRTGLLVAPANHIAFADAVVRLARDAPFRKAVGEAAREHIAERFTTTQMTREFESLYRELINQPKGNFGWFHQGAHLGPFAHLGFSVIGRRLGLQIGDA